MVVVAEHGQHGDGYVGDLDWEYLTARAVHHGPRRVLSLLLYAESNDLAVPNDTVKALFEAVHGI